MSKRVLTVVAVVGALSSAACIVSQDSPPGLTGPSDYATSIRVTATPDTVFLKGDQSVVVIEARGPAGEPFANLRLILKLLVGGVASSCGSLSLNDVMTGSDGRAVVVFTAPKLPLPLPECGSFSGTVTIAATPVGTNSQATNTFTASIALLTPPTPIPSGGFAVNFTMAPNPAKVGQLVTYTDSGSVSPGHALTTFHWSFGDGIEKFGTPAVHDYGVAGTYVVTLTVTDDVGQTGFKSGLLTITP